MTVMGTVILNLIFVGINLSSVFVLFTHKENFWKLLCFPVIIALGLILLLRLLSKVVQI